MSAFILDTVYQGKNNNSITVMHEVDIIMVAFSGCAVQNT